ncbi:MAG: hypothetical protein NTV40_00600 [Solirubrobacterales bacterium]|nr:hypothetical protein [Solirubrobacterales bacterium]
MKRSLASVGIAMAVLVCVATSSATAGAAERQFSPRFSTNVNGRITSAANTILACPNNTVDPGLNAQCEQARAGTGARNNNSMDMRMLDTDSDPQTFNSSQADLVLPDGAEVLFAGLYWTADTSRGDLIKGINGFVGTPAVAPNAAAIGRVLLTVAGASSSLPITASATDQTTGKEYGAFADVTSLVRSAGPGTYTVANVQAGTGGNRSGGWTIVVAYADADEPLRNLAVNDGFLTVAGQALVSIPVSGFKTPATGAVKTEVGVVAYEGDAGVTGDYLTLNDTRLVDAVHPDNNTENSTIANLGSLATLKNPNWKNQLGYDSSFFAADGVLDNGSTSATVRAKTSGDTYLPQVITFATELFSPNVILTKSAAVVGGGAAQPGATVRYTMTATNSGAASATAVSLSDPIPLDVTLISGPDITSGSGNATNVASVITARLGSGATATSGGTLAPGASATVTFEATINGDRPLGDVITNTGTLSFVSPDLGLPISTVASASITVAYPDPGIVKTISSSVGGAYTFALTVTNQGTLPTVGTVTVGDFSDGGFTGVYTMSGSGWTCPSSHSPCTRSDVLAPGASYPPITVVSNYTLGSSVLNTGGVSGGGQPTNASSPALLNDASTTGVPSAPLATLVLNKSVDESEVSAGSLVTFNLLVRNSGPSAGTGTTVVDTLPAGLDFVSATSTAGSCSSAAGASGTTTVSCALGTLAVNGEVRITLRARAQNSIAGMTVTNSATANSDVTTSQPTDTAAVNVRALADLALTKSASLAVANLGDTIRYTLTATNNGPGAAENVQVVDTLPVALDEASAVATPSAGGTCGRTNAEITCVWSGSTAASVVRTVSITAHSLNSVAAEDRKAVNRAAVSSLTDDPDPANNADEVTVTITPAADLAAKVNGPGELEAGAEAQIVFQTTNNGPTAAANSLLVATLPSQLTAVLAPSGCTISGRTITCKLGTINKGSSAITKVKVRGADNANNTQAQIMASVSTSVDDPVESNDTDITPLVIAPVAELSLTKSATPTSASPGATLSFLITLSNGGPSTSNGAQIVDDLPQGMTPTAATSTDPRGCKIVERKVSCLFGDIVPKGTAVVQITARVSSSQPNSTMTNSADVVPGAQRDKNAANNSAKASITISDSVNGPYLSVSKRLTTLNPHSSAPLTYVVTATNTGSASAASVAMSDFPSGSYKLVSIRPSQGTCNAMVCSLGTLQTGAHATITVKMMVPGGKVINAASVKAAGRPSNSDSSIANVAVDSSKIVITAGTSSAHPHIGNKVRITFKVANLSRVFANTVRVCAPVPFSLRFASASGSGRLINGSVCWILGELAPSIAQAGARSFLAAQSLTSKTVSYLATVRTGATTKPGASASGSNVSSVAASTLLAPSGGITG